MQLRLLLLLCLILPALLPAQKTLPAGMTAEEQELMEFYNFHHAVNKFGEATPPPVPVRTMAEWEEIQALVVTWTGYKTTLTQIIEHAKEEVEVVVIHNDTSFAKAQLQNTYGLSDFNNVSFIQSPYNTIWIRDYGANTVYGNEVDSLMLVEWIYNRPRPLDDVIPDKVGQFFDIPVYSTTAAPEDLVHTGGNFTSDGLGTAFSSELVLEENDFNNPYNVTPKTEEDIDQIMFDYMGIEEYIKMPTLPYDGIHHIDMHMRLLNEETIMVGQYPEGIADGPQIEANLQYVLSNFTSPFGTPYKVVRIQMPPDAGDNYPNVPWGDYRTYTNSVLVNKTVLVPIYEEKYDTTALRIYEESMPGYNIIGIDCNDIIQASGALHCITRAVGVNDPLWIVHQQHPDVTLDVTEDYEIAATIKHRSGVNNASVFYKTEPDGAYTEAAMTLTDADADEWTANIPVQTSVTTVYYYIHAEANSGKSINRPLPAPEGYFFFDVTGSPVATLDINEGKTEMEAIFPNPASAITCIPVQSSQALEATIQVTDILGRQIETVFQGQLPAGESKYFIDAARYQSGTYFVTLQTDRYAQVQKVIVK